MTNHLIKAYSSQIMFFAIATFLSACDNKNSLPAFSVEQKKIEKALSEPNIIIEYNFCSIVSIDKATSKNLVANKTTIRDIMGIPSHQLNSFNAYTTGLSIALDSTEGECAVVFAEGKKLYNDSYSHLSAKYRLDWPKPNSNKKSIKEVQQSIFDFAISDQAVRNTWTKLNSKGTNKNLYEKWAQIEAADFIRHIDEETSKYMGGILTKTGWPKKEVYGEYTSFFAWLLIQHADSKPELQKQALKLAKPLLSSGEISRSDYAYLADRVAVNAGVPQLYGTQSTGKCVNGQPEMRSITEPEHLDERRASMGLSSHDKYLLRLSKTICPS